MAFGKKKKKNEEIEVVDATDTALEENEEAKVEETDSNEVEETEEETETVEKNVKPKKKSPIKGVGFIFKLLGAALLLAIFISMSVKFDDAQIMIITVSGALITLLCIARLIFYVKKKDKYSKAFKTMNIVEIIIDASCGIFLLAGGIYYQNNSDSAGKFIDFMQDKYRYFIGIVLYLRGVLHFFATAFFKAKSSVYNYIANIIFITAGTFCMAYEFTLKQLLILLLIVIGCSILYLSYDGIKGAIKYWNGGENNKPKTKKKKKDKKKNDEVPAGIIEPEQKDQAIVS